MSTRWTKLSSARRWGDVGPTLFRQRLPVACLRNSIGAWTENMSFVVSLNITDKSLAMACFPLDTFSFVLFSVVAMSKSAIRS